MKNRFKITAESAVFFAAFCILLCSALKAGAEVPDGAQRTPAQEIKTAGQSSTGAPTPVGPTPVSIEKTYSGDRISLDFHDADINKVIVILGEVSGKNIVVSDAVKGKMTLKVNSMPWDKVLDMVLTDHNLGLEESGNVLTVYDSAELQRIKNRRERIVAEFISPRPLGPMAKMTFTPKNSSVEAVRTELAKLKGGRSKIVMTGDDIYVEDEQPIVHSMKKIFERLEGVTLKTLIEVRIIEAEASFAESLNFTWNGRAVESDLAKKTTAVADNMDSLTVPVTLAHSFISRDLSSVLKADFKAYGTQTFSGPRMMAADGQELVISLNEQSLDKKVGFSVGPATTDDRLNEFTVKLKVEPYIDQFGRGLTLYLKLANDAAESVSVGVDFPITPREAKTRLSISDGDTVAIGGIVIDRDQKPNSYPIGGRRLPLLDWLNSGRASERAEPEILIFVTAYIIPVKI